MAKKRPRREPKKLTIDTIEARSISLVDEFGKERVMMACSGGDGESGGCTVIHIYNGKGQIALTIQVEDQGDPHIALFNRDGSSGVTLGVNDPRGSGVRVADAQGKFRVTMSVRGPATDDPRGPGADLMALDFDARRMWTAFDGEKAIAKKDDAAAQ
jgi:hypothetical protein